MAALLQNCIRFPLEVFEAVRAAFPKEKAGRPPRLLDRLDRGGWDIHQTIEYAQGVEEAECRLDRRVSGGVSPMQKIPLGPGYQVPLAQAIKQATGVTTVAVGLITEAKQAEEIVASGKADMVALARAMLYDPRWGWHAAAELGDQSLRRRNTGARSLRPKRRCSGRDHLRDAVTHLRLRLPQRHARTTRHPPRKRRIQYAAAYRSIAAVSGIPDHPLRG